MTVRATGGAYGHRNRRSPILMTVRATGGACGHRNRWVGQVGSTAAAAVHVADVVFTGLQRACTRVGNETW